jgi:hypothetical protein
MKRIYIFSLPKGKGIKLSIIEEARKRLAASNASMICFTKTVIL